MKAVTVLDLQELLADVAPAESRILYGVSWEDYVEFSKATLNKTNLELTYNRGVLKVNMGQGFRHENLSRFLNSLITTVSLILRVRIISAGSMTLTSSRIRKDADPDESYYIQNAHRASFKQELFDDETDTPPDLVIEIDETHKSDDKFEIYAAFGIKEFWLYDAEVLRIFELSETGEYLLSENSLALPILTATVLTEFLSRSQREDQFKVLTDFQKWLQENK
ncbi:MAG: Uma2 family endonuclease [Pyrinomonadaceae bacterium]|nr:Uma2 family endonuclease [Pyrinomonadaceae bacterium]